MYETFQPLIFIIGLILMFFLAKIAWKTWFELNSRTKSRVKIPTKTVNISPMCLPIGIFARSHETFPAEKIDQIVQRLNLRRRDGFYEMADKDGVQTFITIMNAKNNGAFDGENVSGLILQLVLPVSNDAPSAVNDFLAIAHDMTAFFNGYLGSARDRSPLGKADIANYHRAAQEFQQQYEKVLQ